jgi:hypothetical protein
VYQCCSLGGPDGDAHVCAPLGRICKSAFNITVANIARFVLAPILLAAAGSIRLLMRNSVFVTDDRAGWSGDKARPPCGVAVLHSGVPSRASRAPTV